MYCKKMSFKTEQCFLHPVTKCVELQEICFKPAKYYLRQQEGGEQFASWTVLVAIEIDRVHRTPALED